MTGPARVSLDFLEFFILDFSVPHPALHSHTPHVCARTQLDLSASMNAPQAKSTCFLTILFKGPFFFLLNFCPSLSLSLSLTIQFPLILRFQQLGVCSTANGFAWNHSRDGSAYRFPERYMVPRIRVTNKYQCQRRFKTDLHSCNKIP